MKKVLSILSLVLFLSTLIFSTNVVFAQHHAVGLNQTPTADQCDTPDANFTITAILSIKFDTSLIEVDRGICLRLTLVNNDGVLHDFSLQATNGFDAVFLPVAKAETASVNIQMPDSDVTVEFICSVQGHSETMFGKLKVGEGSSEKDSPGFGLYLAFLGLFGFAALMRTRRKK